MRTVGEVDAPDSELILVHPGAAPVVEVADKLRRQSRGGPLTVPDTSLGAGETKDLMALRFEFVDRK